MNIIPIELAIKFIKLSHLNFHPIEVVFRYRDPQLYMGEITSERVHQSVFPRDIDTSRPFHVRVFAHDGLFLSRTMRII